MYTKYNISKNQIITVSVAIAAIMLLVFCITTKVKAANYNRGKQIRVKSVMIEEGDTLWDIAVSNYTEEYSSISSYIDQIKECNNITSDTIHTGMYLIIPYY